MKPIINTDKKTEILNLYAIGFDLDGLSRMFDVSKEVIQEWLKEQRETERS